MSDTKNKFNSEFGYDLQVDTAKISIDFDTNVGNPVNTILGHNGTQFILVDQNLLDSTNTVLTNDLSGDDGNRKGTVKTYVFEKLIDPSIVGCSNCNSGTDVYNELIMNGELPIINREIIAEFEIEPEAYHSLEIDLVGHRRIGVDGSRVSGGGSGGGVGNVIACGEQNTIALKDGKVYTWGNNTYGQSSPIPTAAQSGVTAIAGGGFHTIALKDDGSVVAWGYNQNGQCSPIPTPAQSGVTAIAGGYVHTIALKNGAVLAWGNNTYGQSSPIPTAALSGVTAIASGEIHTIALKVDGTVVAWGDNSYGQCLGTNTLESAITSPDPANGNNTPVKIGGTTLTGVSAIAGGGYHTIALKDGAVLAWGAGITNTGTFENYGQSIVPTPAQSGVTAIACGYLHTIALKNGEVLAWGDNSYGQLNVPYAATNGVVAIASGRWHNIALKVDGTVVAWGLNNAHQVSPIPISGIFIPSSKTVYNSYISYIDSTTSKALTIPSDLHISGNATTGFEPYKSLNSSILEANHPFLDYSCCPCCDAIESGDPAATTICNNSSQYFITPATTYYDYCAQTTRKYLDSDKNTIENITQCELLKRNKDKYGSLPNTTLPNCNI